MIETSSVSVAISPKGNATFSMDGLYRYHLVRWLRDGGARIVWVMLNPSIAGASEDDPTIRRCVGFSKRLGAASMEVMNLFARISTDPKGLLKEADPVGPRNQEYLKDRVGLLKASYPGVVERPLHVIAAWGAMPKKVMSIAKPLIENLRKATPLKCLGTTRDGHPRHPLYLSAEALLRDYP